MLASNSVIMSKPNCAISSYTFAFLSWSAEASSLASSESWFTNWENCYSSDFTHDCCSSRNWSICFYYSTITSLTVLVAVANSSALRLMSSLKFSLIAIDSSLYSFYCALNLSVLPAWISERALESTFLRFSVSSKNSSFWWIALQTTECLSLSSMLVKSSSINSLNFVKKFDFRSSSKSSNVDFPFWMAPSTLYYSVIIWMARFLLISFA